MNSMHRRPDSDVVLDRGPGRYWLLVDFPVEEGGFERLWIKATREATDGVVDNVPQQIAYATKGDRVRFSWADGRLLFEENLSGGRGPVRAWADLEAEAATKVEAEATEAVDVDPTERFIPCPKCGAPTSKVAFRGAVTFVRSCGSCGWESSFDTPLAKRGGTP